MFISLLYLLSLNGFAAEPSSLYIEGVKLYQEQRYVDAVEKFSIADQAEMDNPFTLYNWGLSAFKVEKKGLGVALWRRALFVDPEFTAASEALQFAKENMPDEVFRQSDDSIENLKTGLLRRLSMNKLFLLNVLLLGFSGWLLIRYFGQYKTAIEDEKPLPNFPNLGALFTAIFIFSLFIGGVKFFTQNEIRATVIESSVDLKTGPSEESNSVYTLLEGFEVIIENTQNDWTLVTYPGGMTGWIPKTKLFINSGSREW